MDLKSSSTIKKIVIDKTKIHLNTIYFLVPITISISDILRCNISDISGGKVCSISQSHYGYRNFGSGFV